jgi:hypothetical protein
MKLSNQVLLGPDKMPVQDPRNHPDLYTTEQTDIWDRAGFTVPANVSDERVQSKAAYYQNIFGTALELQGFEVLRMDPPIRDTGFVAEGTTDPDRKKYLVWAKVRRRPVEVKVDVPDEDVPIYLASGYKLAS